MVFTTEHRTFIFELVCQLIKFGNIVRFMFRRFSGAPPRLNRNTKGFLCTVTNCIGIFAKLSMWRIKELLVKQTVHTQVVNDIRQRLEQEFVKCLKRPSGNWTFLCRTYQTIVKKDLGRHPYKLQSYQSALRTDHSRRLEYTQWLVNHLMNDDLLNLAFFLMNCDFIFRDTSILKMHGALIIYIFMFNLYYRLKKLVFGWQFIAEE